MDDTTNETAPLHTKPLDEADGSIVQVPRQAHVREDYESTLLDEHDSDDELEATELRPVRHDDLNNRLPRLSHILSPGKPQIHWYDPGKKFWRHHIRISVPHDDCRDHLANERTFLGYLRTSVALSMIGIIIAQLYRLQHAPDPNDVYGYFVLSKPLSVIFQIAALCMVLLGFVRFWRQQSAMAIGRVHAGGWEINSIVVGSFLLLLMMFAVHIGIDVYKTDHHQD